MDRDSIIALIGIFSRNKMENNVRMAAFISSD